MRTRQTMMVSATALTVTAALAIGGVSPAFADPTNEKTGSITCPTGRTAVLKTSDWGGRYYEHRTSRTGPIVTSKDGDFHGDIHTSSYGGGGTRYYYAYAEVTNSVTLWGCYN